MAGLDPAIHVFAGIIKEMDARLKAGMTAVGFTPDDTQAPYLMHWFV